MNDELSKSTAKKQLFPPEKNQNKNLGNKIVPKAEPSGH